MYICMYMCVCTCLYGITGQVWEDDRGGGQVGEDRERGRQGKVHI